MKHDVVNLQNKSVGSVELEDGVFGTEVREDILHRVVTWQLAKRRAGSHKAKTLSEVRGSTSKPYRQKGTGRARAGTMKAPHRRGGGAAFGPVVRSHAHKLPKKVRRLGLKAALSAKVRDGKLMVVDSARLEKPKTSDFAKMLKTLGLESALFIDGSEADANLSLAARNVVGIDVLPQQGANVYDILRRDVLVLTKAAVEQLEARLK